MANKRATQKSAVKNAVEGVLSEATAVETAPVEKSKTARTNSSTKKEAAAADEITPAPKQKTTRAKKSDEKLAEDKFIIQGSKDYTMSEIKEACKEAFKGGTRKHVKSIDVYLKSENGNLRAYYVINGKADGAFIDL